MHFLLLQLQSLSPLSHHYSYFFNNFCCLSCLYLGRIPFSAISHFVHSLGKSIMLPLCLVIVFLHSLFGCLLGLPLRIFKHRKWVLWSPSRLCLSILLWGVVVISNRTGFVLVELGLFLCFILAGFLRVVLKPFILRSLWSTIREKYWWGLALQVGPSVPPKRGHWACVGCLLHFWGTICWQKGLTTIL